MNACLRAWATFALLLAALLCIAPTHAEDGYDLWLRYRPLAPSQAKLYQTHISQLIIDAATPTRRAARSELQRGLHGLLDRDIPLVDTVTRDGAVIAGTPASSALIARLSPDTQHFGKEGYLIRSVVVNGHAATVIAARDDIGALYGVFHFLRLVQTGQPMTHLDLHEAPRLKLRVLDHWDYLNGQVERGYAGASIWDWWKLPDWRAPRYTDYARANASIGINGTVLNNVNAGATILTPAYLEKVAALADVFRPYGIRVYLSIRFSADRNRRIENGGSARSASARVVARQGGRDLQAHS